MVKHTQTIRRQEPTNCLNVFDHFVGLALKGLTLQCFNLFHATGFILYPLNTSEKQMLRRTQEPAGENGSKGVFAKILKNLSKNNNSKILVDSSQFPSK